MNIPDYFSFYRKINRSGIFYRNLFVSVADVDGNNLQEMIGEKIMNIKYEVQLSSVRETSS